MFVFFQRLLPKHLLSRIVGIIANCELRLVSQTFINVICAFYDINLQEAERTNRQDYKSFNDFFTRSLRKGVRPIAEHWASPADGVVAAMGQINGDTLIQSKKHTYSMRQLLADSELREFSEGSFITIYLAPHNYHRVHLPIDATLDKAIYVPGELFSVNQNTANSLPGLFARNERLVCRFSSDQGEMAMVLVGAMLVAGIKPTWMDRPYKPKLQITTEMKQAFNAGDELGQFQMGSTVILLSKQKLNFNVSDGDLVNYGQSLTA